MRTMTLTISPGTRVDTDAPLVAPYCPQCEQTTAPDGTCLAIGSCPAADAAATRGAAHATAKYAVPAAWNARGSVD